MTLATKEWVISLLNKSLKKNKKTFVGLISTATEFTGKTFKCIDSSTNKIVDQGKIDEDGEYYLYLSKQGKYIFQIEDRKTTFSWSPEIIWTGAGIFMEPLPEFFYRSGAENNTEGRYNMQNTPGTGGQKMVVDDNYIKLENAGNSYNVAGSNIAYFGVDLSNVNHIYITTSRTNTNGRMYLFAAKQDPVIYEGTTSLENSSAFPVYSYITDTQSKVTKSINVSSLNGIYYVGLANAGSNTNTTYIHDWYWD